MDVRRQIGQRVRERRRRLGLSQAQLARRARLSQTAVAKVERGEGGRLEVLARIADAISLPLAALFRRTGPPPPPLTVRKDLVGLMAALEDLPPRDVRVVAAVVAALRGR